MPITVTMMVALVSQWDAATTLPFSIVTVMLANVRILARANGAVVRSLTALGALAMESFVLQNGAIPELPTARELVAACGVPTVGVLVRVPLPQPQHPRHFRYPPHRHRSAPAPDPLPPQDTGIALAVLVGVPTYRLGLAQTMNLLIAIPMPCLPHQLVTNMAHLSMEPLPSLKFSLVTIRSGLDLAVEHATS